MLNKIEELLSAFGHCEKGLCLTPATRQASYYAEGRVVAAWPSCDNCGGEPLKEFPYAELLRMASDVLRAARCPGWWEGYSGALRPALRSMAPEELIDQLESALRDQRRD